MAIKRDVEVDAVLSEDIVELIKELGIYKEFEQGEYHCYICGDIINYENLRIIFPLEDNEVGFVCGKPGCFVDFALTE